MSKEKVVDFDNKVCTQRYRRPRYKRYYTPTKQFVPGKSTKREIQKKNIFNDFRHTVIEVSPLMEETDRTTKKPK
jgi:hypothetical protein